MPHSLSKDNYLCLTHAQRSTICASLTLNRALFLPHSLSKEHYLCLPHSQRTISCAALTLKVAISWNSSQSTKPWIIDRVASNDRFLSRDELTVLSSRCRKCTIWKIKEKIKLKEKSFAAYNKSDNMNSVAISSLK